MFSKDKNSEGRSERSMPPTIISVNVNINGNLSSDGEIQVDGTIEGDVKCAQLSVGETGSIQGNVPATKTLVHGKITGQIESIEVTLSSTAKVQGDLLHQTLAIETGAQFEGNCRRMEKAQRSVETNINLVASEDKHPQPTPSADAALGAAQTGTSL